MKALKVLGGIIAGVIVVAAVLLAIGMPAGFLTSAIQQRVERETGYHLTVAGSTRIGLWPSPNIEMSDVTLENPDDRDESGRVSVGSIQAKATLASLWSGHPDVTDLVIDHPVVSIPLHRERRPHVRPTSSQPNAPSNNGSGEMNIKRVTVTDGTMRFFNTRDHVEDHIEGISAKAVIDADRRLVLNGNARAGGQPLTFDIKASLPDSPVEHQSIPLELSLDAPALLKAPLSSKAEVRRNGSVIMINGISGAIGDGAFSGWASVDVADKPLVKLDLDFRRLDIATAASQAAPQSAPRAWSSDPIELKGLNYVDAQIRLSAAELNIGESHFAPVALEGSLTSGVLKAAATNVAAYGGQANGTIDIDVTHDTSVYAIHGDIAGVQALPLLKSVADFDKLDGKLQARIDVRSNGQSQQAIMSNLSGTAVANFRDGAIKGLNVAQMIRSLTSGTLSGWQEGEEKATDLSQLSASFRIENGEANTSDLNLIGPLVKMTGAGTVDIGAKTLALRVEPKLVLTTEGQGRASDPVGFGIPVAINGPWNSPRIYPDIAGILDNPEAAYAKLKQMGIGLFAPGEPGSESDNGTGGSSLGDTLGNLIQQGLNAARSRNKQPDSPNDPSAPNDPSHQQNSQPLNDIMKQLFGR